jgi:two-component system sensor histidine kinase RegB
VTATTSRVQIGTGRGPARVVLRPIPVADRLSSPQLGLLWLVRLRWHALGALALAMTLAPWLMGVSVPWMPAFAIGSGIALSNLAALAWARSGRRVRALVPGALIAGDTLWLTAALALSGGAQNPFVSLYVIQVTLAALLLDLAWVIGIGAASVAAFALLLASPPGAEISPGIEGTLAALAITLGINATLVVRTVRAFRERQEALARAQREAALAEKLASLTTLAAGAAHELATPLGTIAVAATELPALIESEPEQALSEARLIREQVARCKQILQRLGSRAGSEPGEVPRRTTPGELFALLQRELGARAARLRLEADATLAFDAPIEGLVAVLANLASNGLAASAPAASVTLALTEHAGQLRFVTSDTGTGIDPALLPRLGEPFFTTKAPGEGLGLGLFLAFRFAATHGGRLEIDSAPGRGTRVQLELPSSRGAAT